MLYFNSAVLRKGKEKKNKEKSNIKTAVRRQGGGEEVTATRKNMATCKNTPRRGVINSADSLEERGNVDEWLIRMAERI